MDKVKELETNYFIRKIGLFITSFGLIVCMIALLVLSIGSILCSFLGGYTRIYETGFGQIFLKNPKIIIAPIVITLILFLLSYFLLKLKKVNWKLLLLVSACITFGFQLWWIVGQHTTCTYYSDAHQLLDYAEALSSIVENSRLK